MVSGTGRAEGKSLPAMVGLALAADGGAGSIDHSSATAPLMILDPGLFNNVAKCVPID